jgi:uncharacterized protein YeaC (DUF1315 family)
MDLHNTINNMSKDMYTRLKCAAETGKWPEGTVVDKAQRATALQLIMAYQSTHENSDEMLTIGNDGQIVEKNKRQLKAEFSSNKDNEETAPCVKPSAADIAYFSNDQL